MYRKLHPSRTFTMAFARVRHPICTKRYLAAIFGWLLGIGALASAQAKDCKSSDPANWPSPAKPYFILLVDTGSSMIACTTPVGEWPHTCDTSTSGTPLNSCGMVPTRINDAKCALKNTVDAFAGSVNFGLVTYASALSDCPAGACISECAGTDGTDCNEDSYGCTVSPFPDPNSYTGGGPWPKETCGNWPDCVDPGPGAPNAPKGTWLNGGNIVVPLESDPVWDETLTVQHNVDELHNWFDGDCTDNKELYADGWKPMPGALQSLAQYLRAGWSKWSATEYCDASLTYTSESPLVPQDSNCRSVNILFVTDGELDNCGMDGVLDDFDIAQNIAADLYENGVTVGPNTYKVRTHTINFDGGFTDMSDAIAANGGTGSSIVVTDENTLSQSLANIIAGAIPPEVCDNVDNNCNECVDEGYPHYCNLNPGCCTDPREVCLANYEASLATDPPDGDLTLLPCVDESLVGNESDWLCINPREACNEIDDNCDGQTDEGFIKCGNPLHCPETEVCNGIDDDCDGHIDEDQAIGDACANSVSGDPTGICDEGNFACILGKWVCNGTPAADEQCDGLDNDCDGQTDESEDLFGVGEICGNDLGICESGTYQCTGSGPNPDNYIIDCVGDTFGETETCNGFDDDCDGEIDEKLGLGDVCTNSPTKDVVGECKEGYEECIAGDWICNGPEPGPEMCNGLDDDCDGQTDEALEFECPKNSICVLGECQERCTSQELACPSGKTCETLTLKDKSAVSVCVSDVCSEASENALACASNPFWCDEGFEAPCHCDASRRLCVGLCEKVICPDGKVCIPADGMCQAIDDSCWTMGCESDSICIGGKCVDDPCAAVECADGQYCNPSGTCVELCLQGECKAGCFEGECVDDPCVGIPCDPGLICDKGTLECIPDTSCQNVVCHYFEVCRQGECIENPCWNLDCPNSTQCIEGACYEYASEGDVDTDTDSEEDTDSNGLDGGSANANNLDSVLATGVGGCLCTSWPGSNGNQGTRSILVIFAVLGLFGWIRRRRWWLFIAVTMAIPIVGCEVDPYDFEGRETEEDSGSTDTQEECLPGSPDDDCDGFDDNCDGATDDGVDFLNDPVNCGECGNDCSQKYPFAYGECKSGTCEMVGCATYYQDLNKDDSDGCEYYCKQTAISDLCNGVDLGDGNYVGVDDDCDGQVDEDVDFESSESNCGACGRVCQYDNAIPICDDSTCSLETCIEGFWNADGELANGCEYACIKQSDTETCNGRDDNCDGVTDEALVAPDTALICGVSPNTSRSECASTEIGGDIAIECVGGNWVCTFPAGVCDPTCAEAEEICDDLDNDCDAILNENVPNFGEPCASDDATPDQTHGACRTLGTYICNGEQASVCNALKADCNDLPGGCTEACDHIDNDCDGSTDEPFSNKGADLDYFVKPAVTQVAESLWIYTFEASRPNATDAFPGFGNGYHCLEDDCPPEIPAPDGSAPPPLDMTRSCSVQHRIPWFNVTPIEAEQTCHAAGGKICTGTEWRNACETTASTPCSFGYSPRGTSCENTATYPDAGDTYCNLAPFDFDAAVAGNQAGLLTAASPRLENCAADWSGLYTNDTTHPLIFDMTGNLREITKSATNAYPLMGGSFNSDSENGSKCTFDFYTVEAAFKFFDTGFRCCFSADPTK